MRLSDFDYRLPPELIAQYPLEQRSSSRLLCLDGLSGSLRDSHFSKLPELLGPGDLLVLNDTRVIPARLYGQKLTGGRVEILIERLAGKNEAVAHIRASKPPREGTRIALDGGFWIEITGRHDELYRILSLDVELTAVLEQVGHLPLPPYIERPDTFIDRERYQTVFGTRPGAVAAPTAGLHFDQDILDRLAARGVALEWVPLHVGAGTFQPIRSERIEDHVMHSEYVEVGLSVCERVERTRRQGGRVVAVGTTSVRSLETAAASGKLRPYRGDTSLFITPGYRFHCVDAMITNFHLPRSTLLMLVAAFSGYPQVMEAYRHAVAARYRFFSYGDAMLLSRQ